MPLKNSGKKITIKEAIEQGAERAIQISQKFRNLLQEIEDESMRKILYELFMLILISTNTNVFRIHRNQDRIEKLKRTDDETRELIEPFLTMLEESEKSPRFIV